MKKFLFAMIVLLPLVGKSQQLTKSSEISLTTASKTDSIRYPVFKNDHINLCIKLNHRVFVLPLLGGAVRTYLPNNNKK
jgi:hypothetical protein